MARETAKELPVKIPWKFLKLMELVKCVPLASNQLLVAVIVSN